ncbi:MAG: TIGR04086 family membrane protein [bacterium]|nr:TIGR04086 family membrane protein [bacterium]
MKFNIGKQFIIAGIVGVLFVITLLIIAFTVECPTEFQNQIFKIVMALAAGAFAVMIPGAISINYKGVVSASGAIAVLVMVYFFSPSTPLDSSLCSENATLRGLVTISGKPAGDVDVFVRETDQLGHSNKVGKFTLTLTETELPKTLSLFCQSEENGIDTVVYIASKELNGVVSIDLKKGQVAPQIQYRGNIYMDGTPLENASVVLPQLRTQTSTDQYGFFNVMPENRVSNSKIKMIITHRRERINESLDVAESELIAYADINVTPFEDTTAETPRVKIVNPIESLATLDVKLPASIQKQGSSSEGESSEASKPAEEYCLICMRFDEEGKTTNYREKCSTDLKYLNDMKAGYAKSSEDRGVKYSCKFRASDDAIRSTNTLTITPKKIP